MMEPNRPNSYDVPTSEEVVFSDKNRIEAIQAAQEEAISQANPINHEIDPGDIDPHRVEYGVGKAANTLGAAPKDAYNYLDDPKQRGVINQYIMYYRKDKLRQHNNPSSANQDDYTLAS